MSSHISRSEKEIDDVVARGPFELEQGRDEYKGLVQGRIVEGRVFQYGNSWRRETRV
jgi:hypothetical protein